MNTHRTPGPTACGALVPARARRWLYGIAAAAAPLTVAYGYVTDSQAVLWLNLAGAALFTMAIGNTPTRPGDPPVPHDETTVDADQGQRNSRLSTPRDDSPGTDPLDPTVWPTA